MRQSYWSKKPPKSVISIDMVLDYAETKKKELPKLVQVFASDWYVIILADEIKRVRKAQEK
jgi:hypothetical protein